MEKPVPLWPDKKYRVDTYEEFRNVLSHSCHPECEKECPTLKLKNDDAYIWCNELLEFSFEEINSGIEDYEWSMYQSSKMISKIQFCIREIRDIIVLNQIWAVSYIKHQNRMNRMLKSKN